MITTSVLICMTVFSIDMRNADIICDNAHIIEEMSKTYDLDPSLIIAVGRIESAWTPKARSPANACGVMQVLPKYSKKFSNKGRNLTCDELKDPETGIRVGTKILSYWLHKYAKGNETIALCGYNAGFRCKGDNKNKQGLKYAKAVLKYRKYFKRKMRIQERKYKNERFANH